ncbi:MAG: hypothetical protein IT450_17480 [Phycisphaerales bacterium]|nr:hypothetical protein [Phycisphaerales bacterium]
MRRRRSRVRWVLKWTGTVACGLIVLLGVVGVWRMWVILYRGTDWFVGVGAGSVQFSWSNNPQTLAGFSRLPWIGPPVSEDLLADDWARLSVWVTSDVNPIYQYFGIPLWMPLAFFGALTGWLWWWDRRRIDRGGCLKCGYDLTGNVSGRCPECGAAVEAKPGAGG